MKVNKYLMTNPKNNNGWKNRVRQLVGNVPKSDLARHIINLIHSQSQKRIEKLEGLKKNLPKRSDYGDSNSDFHAFWEMVNYVTGVNKAIDKIIQEEEK